MVLLRYATSSDRDHLFASSLFIMYSIGLEFEFKYNPEIYVWKKIIGELFQKEGVSSENKPVE